MKTIIVLLLAGLIGASGALVLWSEANRVEALEACRNKLEACESKIVKIEKTLALYRENHQFFAGLAETGNPTRHTLDKLVLWEHNVEALEYMLAEEGRSKEFLLETYQRIDSQALCWSSDLPSAPPP